MRAERIDMTKITSQPTIEDLSGKQRKVKCIRMKVPEHLKSRVEDLILQDELNFKSSEGRYRKL
jgi:hypothetical protein